MQHKQFPIAGPTSLSTKVLTKFVQQSTEFRCSMCGTIHTQSVLSAWSSSWLKISETRINHWPRVGGWMCTQCSCMHHLHLGRLCGSVQSIVPSIVLKSQAWISGLLGLQDQNIPLQKPSFGNRTQQSRYRPKCPTVCIDGCGFTCSCMIRLHHNGAPQKPLPHDCTRKVWFCLFVWCKTQ